MINMEVTFVRLLAGKGRQCGRINVCLLSNAILSASDAVPLTNINHIAQVLTIRRNASSFGAAIPLACLHTPERREDAWGNPARMRLGVEPQV
jgi:hypothetical protein